MAGLGLLLALGAWAGGWWEPARPSDEAAPSAPVLIEWLDPGNDRRQVLAFSSEPALEQACRAADVPAPQPSRERRVADGSQVLVRRNGTLDVRAMSGASALAVGRPMDMNRASVIDLTLLPGIGPVTAEKIDAHRRRTGPFRSVDDLLQVSGIGPATLERIRPWVGIEP